MADKDYNKIQMYRKEFLTRKLLLAGTKVEFFDGDGSSGQVMRMSKHAEELMAVIQLCDSTGVTEFPPNKGRAMLQTATLTAKDRAYTYNADDKSITFGDGTDGYKPPDTSSDSFFAIAIVYIPVTGSYTVSTTYTWTEQTIADNVTPDTDPPTYCDGATEVSILFDTDGASTGAPAFDLNIIASLDGTTYQDGAQPLVTAFTAQLKDVEDITHINVGAAKEVKPRLDVAVANLVATEFVTATFKVTWRY